jgi:hypothetical protein
VGSQHGRQFRLVSLLTLVVAFAFPAGAGAVTTFGADLNGPVSSFATCAPSCLLYSVSAGTTFYAPESGIVNTVRLKTGDVPQGTGQMQLVVERSFYQNNPNSPGHPNFACCFIQQYGPTFTAQRNTINTITNASLGFVEQPTPASTDFNTVAKADFLALSVLGSDVPLPTGSDSGGFLSYVIPAPSPGTTPAPSPNPYSGSLGGEVPGYKVMMSADLEPVGTPSGAAARCKKAKKGAVTAKKHKKKCKKKKGKKH